MSKADVVSGAKVLFIQAQDQSLQVFGESVYDGGFGEGVASVPPADADEQAKIDAAVAAAVGPLNDQIALLQGQVSADADLLKSAQDKASSDLSAVQSALDTMTAKEQLEEQAVADVKAKIDQVQASFDAIRALFQPAPVPQA